MLRHQMFQTWRPQPQEMMERIQGWPEHEFLLNPSGCQPFLYLTEFLIARIVERWQLPPAETDILDWGCGKGHVSYLLSRQGYRPVGADMPEYGQNWPLLKAASLPFHLLGDPWRLPFEDQSFHAVLSFGVLEHVADDQASLREIRRILRPGGMFFCFNLPRSGSWIMHLAHLQGNHYHDRLYDRRGVVKLLDQAGLKLDEMWVRQILPKNRICYPWPWLFERVDQWLCENTPLAILSTSLEFIATRP